MAVFSPSRSCRPPATSSSAARLLGVGLFVSGALASPARASQSPPPAADAVAPPGAGQPTGLPSLPASPPTELLPTEGMAPLPPAAASPVNPAEPPVPPLPPPAPATGPPPRLVPPPPPSPSPYLFRGIDLAKMKLRDGRYQQKLPDGTTAIFTLEPKLQQRAERALKRSKSIHSGVVALEPATGRILAWTGSSQEVRPPWKIPGNASPYAASTFKVVTAAALLETTPVNEQTTVCYSGGFSRLSDKDVVGDPRRDHTCAPFRYALARSANAVFARLAYQHLDRATLLQYAERFGFGDRHASLPFPVEPSRADLPSDREKIELARAAAGFFHTYQSPLEGAVMIATVANHGLRMQPQFVDRLLAADGSVLFQASPVPVEQAIKPETAERLTRLMVLTTTAGTARQRFTRRWRHREIEVAGKTGSLSRQAPFTHYTWFVAYAPATAPQIAVSALVGNGALWHIKGLDLAREVLDSHFGGPDRDEVAPRRAAPRKRPARVPPKPRKSNKK